jgi:hypothetical protein
MLTDRIGVSKPKESMSYSFSGDPGAKVVTEGTASCVSDVRSGSLCASYFNGVAKVGPVVLAFKNCPDENPKTVLLKLGCWKYRLQAL